ncbi:two-component system response regulator YesN [Paenibacillus phyllosphaerae]|uniref:Two-component system response regulator YesN n=1 Tax=Paenibacillus phyllosphaerae TaxID=274593 RepID=A0A7W5B0A8_9BACL|nr:response regulator [Paenibacillus phyllosphaerae]MBB3111744.1 two-component system response regulator YesN [Paenibacillus phyllosphaerae]
MKVLLVDDEARHLRGMTGMMRAIRPDYEVFVSKNGMDALELVRSERPEIVITDIRMPMMDGLTFMAKLSELKLRPKVIFLTAYNLFEYAQSALRNGAFDYLLKPVDLDAVDEVLKRIEEQLDNESAQRNGTKDSTALLHLLRGQHSYRPEQIRDLPVFMYEPGVVMKSHVEDLTGGLQPTKPEELCRDLESVFSGIGEAHVYLETGDQEKEVKLVTVLCAKAADVDRAAVRVRLTELANRPAYRGMKLVHGIGTLSSSLLAEGRNSYRTANLAILNTFYDKWNGIIFADERVESTADTTEFDVTALFEAARDYQAERGLTLIRQWFDRLSGEGWTDPIMIKEQASLLMMKLKSRSYAFVKKETAERMSEAAASDIPNSDSYFAVLALVEARYLELAQSLQQMKRGRGEYVAESCVQLIRERFMEDLMLENIAEQFYFNPSYFSSMFKNHTGMTFSEFLTDTRIKHAKELLADAENALKIYDVAERCGYRDTKYFSRVFKSHVGVSPEAYRGGMLGSGRT